MLTLVVKLPSNRDFCGELSLVGADGGLLAGPFEVAGRANAAAASQAGNPDRSTLLPYGDTPVGQYRLETVLRSGAGTGYSARLYGGHGVLVLRGTAGDAALAEANGRFHFFVQGGATHKDGRLCSTNGAMRLRNADLAMLVAALQAASDTVECWCLEDRALAATATVYAGNKYHEGDPPAMPEALQSGPQLSRRRMMGAGAALGSVRMARVLLPGVFIGGEAIFSPAAMAAYDGSNGNDNTNPDGTDNNNPDGTDNNNYNNGNPNGTNNGTSGNNNGSPGDNQNGNNGGNANPPNTAY